MHKNFTYKNMRPGKTRSSTKTHKWYRARNSRQKSTQYIIFKTQKTQLENKHIRLYYN